MAIVAEIKRDWIEEIAEYARQGDQQDATAGEIDTAFPEIGDDP